MDPPPYLKEIVEILKGTIQFSGEEKQNIIEFLVYINLTVDINMVIEIDVVLKSINTYDRLYRVLETE
jgi:hypothetical protein